MTDCVIVALIFGILRLNWASSIINITVRAMPETTARLFIVYDVNTVVITVFILLQHHTYKRHSHFRNNLDLSL